MLVCYSERQDIFRNVIHWILIGLWKVGIAYQSRATLNVGLLFCHSVNVSQEHTAYVTSTEKDVSEEEQVLKNLINDCDGSLFKIQNNMHNESFKIRALKLMCIWVNWINFAFCTFFLHRLSDTSWYSYGESCFIFKHNISNFPLPSLPK